MIKAIIILLIILSVHPGKAQEHVLRIVSCSEHISCNGSPVAAGQLITDSKSKLVVTGEDSYAYVITPKGYSYKLGHGNYTVGNLEDMIYRKKYVVRRATGAVYTTPWPIELIGLPLPPQSFMMGDSVFIHWKKGYASAQVGPPYHFTVMTMFADVLYETDINGTSVRLNVRKYNESAILLKVASGKETSDQPVVKFMKTGDDVKIVDALSGIPSGDVNLKILELVIYDNNDLVYDLLFHFEKINRSGPVDLPDDLKNYLALLRTKFEL